jgi:serine/threonine-protein kinase
MLQEGRIQAQLRHPNLVRVTDVLRDGGLVALLMEYVEGQTLEQHVHEHGPMTVDEVLSLMAPILGAVAVAHDAKVLHRDLKPANVMLERRGSSFNPKVMDFGIAKALADSGTGASTRPNAILGTPEYMAPEQFIDAGQATPAVDVFALGVLFQYCVTGVGAFEPSSADRPLMESLMRQPRPLPDDLPESVRMAIRVAMSNEPSDRYPHARDFAQALFKDYPALAQLVGEPTESSGGLDPQAFTTGAPAPRVNRPGHPTPSPTLTPMGSAPFEPPVLRRSKTPLLLAAVLMVGVVGLLWWWMAENPAVPEGPIYAPVTDVVAPALPPVPVVEPVVDADTDVPEPTVILEPDSDSIADVQPSIEPFQADTESPEPDTLEPDTEVSEADTEGTTVAVVEPVVAVVAVAEPNPEPDVQRVNLDGRWVGTADGRPFVLTLSQGIDGTLNGDATFTLGTTQRSFTVIGVVSGEGVTLDASGSFRFVGTLRNGDLAGTYTARQRSRSFPWSTTRDE